MPSPKPSIISLFCGAGGLDLGFRQAGFHVALACDSDESAVASSNLNTRPKVGRLADLSTLKSGKLVELIAEASPNSLPAGVIGGPPCQGFSRGNAYGDPSDPRNKLPFRYASLLAGLNRKFNLKFFVFENVLGLLNPRHEKRFKAIQRRFRDAGFRIFQQELNALHFGVAQRRRRLFIVGLNESLFPEAEFEFPSGRGAPRSVRDVISGLPRATLFRRGMTSNDVKCHPNHWTMQPKSKKLARKTSAESRSFRRLDWDQESPTVAYGNREIHVHPEGGRRLTVLEAMLLQGFPRTYTLAGNFSEQVTQVSNAVPPPVAKALARRILKTIHASR
jgi:DNA (cytosine-5)-methyltransferase 1